MQTIPSEITPMVEQSNNRLTRLLLDKKTGFNVWKTVQMMMRPTITGSDPRSPERTRSKKLRNAPETPSSWRTRVSWRSRGVFPVAWFIMLLPDHGSHRHHAAPDGVRRGGKRNCCSRQ